MSDVREMLDRRAQEFRPTPDTWDRLIRRAHRRQRNRRIGAGVLALTVFAGTSLGLWRALQSDRSTPTPVVEPSIEATFPLRAIDLAVGEGSVWVLGVLDPATGQDAVWRIDPATNRVVATIPLPGTTDKHGIAAGAGAVWVGAPPVDVIRIDSSTNEVTGENKISSFNLYDAPGLAAGEGGVWVSVRGGGTFVKLDPATGRASGPAVSASAPLGGCCAPVAGSRVANFWHGTLFLIGPAARETAGRLLRSVNGVGDLAANQEGVWVTGTTNSDTGAGSVWRIDPTTGVVLARISVPYAWSLDVNEEGVWVATDPYSQGSFSDPNQAPPAAVLRIDPSTNREVGEPLRFAGPGGLVLVAGEGGVWAIHYYPLVMRIGLAHCPSTGCPTPTPIVIPTPSPTPTPSLPPFALTSLKMLTPTAGWATSSDTDTGLARVLRTTDGGTSWMEVTPPQIKGDRLGIIGSFLDASHAWVAWPRYPNGGGGPVPVTVFATSDGGRTWTSGHPFVSKPGWDGMTLDFIDSQHGWALAVIAAAAGNDPVEVWRTSDGGSTWESMSRSDTSFFPGLAPGTPGALPPCAANISFLDQSAGFADSLCAPGTQLFVTHDAGRTWSPQSVSPPPPRAGGPVGPPLFVSSKDGFWVFAGPQLGPGTRVYITHDGGHTWTTVRLPATPMDGLPSFVDGLHFVYFAAPSLFVTADGGLSWTPISPNVDLSGSILDFVDPQHGWAISRDPSQNPFLLATNDGGHTWAELPLTLAG